jgi:hypothetical protein
MNMMVRHVRRKKPAVLLRRRGVFSFFSKISHSVGRSKRSSAKPNPRWRKVLFLKIRRFLVLALIVLFVVGIGYAIVRSVLLVKNRGNGDSSLITEESTGDVVGIPNVPVYPGSAFMFSKHIEDELVQSFLLKGRSAYVLPSDVEWQGVVDFYIEELPSRGWKHVLTVDLADRERLNGEYWVFEVVAEGVAALPDTPTSSVSDQAEAVSQTTVDTAKSYGLRIYSKVRSVWYERISYEDAQTGLSSEVAREKEIDLILSMGTTVELPEPFPWKLAYPELWDVEIRASRLDEAPLAEFSGGDLVGPITIEPVVYETGKTLDEVGQSFLDEVNGRRSEDTQLVLVTTSDIQIAGLPAKVFNLELGNVRGYMAIVSHPGNGIVYAITSFVGDEAYFGYVVEHLEVR